jgi:hypothetical protein
MNRSIGCKFRRFFWLLAVVMICLSNTAWADLAKAPALLECQTLGPTDLGTWDDVYECADQDFILARREDSLVLISTDIGFVKTNLAKSSMLKDTLIDSAVRSGDRIWVFFKSSKAVPFAFDVHAGKTVQFVVPGLAVPGSQTPRIDCCVPVRSAHAAIVSVSGGDAKTWPRDGNRPVYFWLSLDSGKIIQFPIGWDLDYFSSDQSVAVFAKGEVMSDGRRAFQGIDMKTGAAADKFPNSETELFVGYDWEDRTAIKALSFGQSLLPNVNYLQGVSINGDVFHIDIPNSAEQGNVLDKMKATDGFVGFCFSRSGHVGPRSFWLAPLKDHGKAENLGDCISDFSLLSAGRCAVAITGKPQENQAPEMLFEAYDNSSSWDVMDGIAHPPDAGGKRADGGYVKDEASVHLIDGVGSSEHAPITFAIFSVTRRQAGPFSGAEDVKVIWRRVIAITGEGKRYMTSLFQNGIEPDGIWLNKAGTTITVTRDWQGPNSSKIRLSGFELKLP